MDKWPAIARNIDPATSHAAADVITTGGKRQRRLMLDISLSAIEDIATHRQRCARQAGRMNQKLAIQSALRIEIDGLIGEFAVAQYFAERRGEDIYPHLEKAPDDGYDLVIDGHTVDVKFSRYSYADLFFTTKGSFRAQRAILAVAVSPNYISVEHPEIRLAGWIRREEFLERCLGHPLPYTGKRRPTWQGVGMTQPTAAVKDCPVCPYHYSPIHEITT